MPGPSESDKELEHYKAVLRRQELDWQAKFQKVLHSDRAAVDVGLTTLRTAILINGAAVVAILAFVGQLWGRDTDTLNAVLAGAAWFVIGVGLAGVAACVAYFYQSFVTAEQQRWLADVADDREGVSAWFWLRVTAAVVMVGLVLASYALFVWGAFVVIGALAR